MVDNMRKASMIRVLGLVAVGLLGGGLLLAEPAAAGPTRVNAEQTWSPSTPTVPGAAITSLDAVTCVTPADCWAVGARFIKSSSNSGPALIEHYLNGKWSPVTAAPAERATLDQLAGVSCLSSTDCWAVGMRSGSYQGSLVEHFDGHGNWAAVSAPAPQGSLFSVSCDPTSRECWAVGSSSNFRSAVSFRLVGNVWHYVKSVPLSASFVQANGVACATEDDCLLVGFLTPKHGALQALAEHWNGQRWSRVSVPGELPGGGSLAGVGCLPGSSPVRAGRLVKRYRKVPGWSRYDPSWSAGTANRSPSSQALSGPRATTPSSRRSHAPTGRHVRRSDRGAGEDEALVLAQGWNGSHWSNESSASPLYGFQTLSGVVCPSASDCWAVGEGLNRSASGSRMIIEHYSLS